MKPQPQENKQVVVYARCMMLCYVLQISLWALTEAHTVLYITALVIVQCGPTHFQTKLYFRESQYTTTYTIFEAGGILWIMML